MLGQKLVAELCNVGDTAVPVISRQLDSSQWIETQLSPSLTHTQSQTSQSHIMRPNR